MYYKTTNFKIDRIDKLPIIPLASENKKCHLAKNFKTIAEIL